MKCVDWLSLWLALGLASPTLAQDAHAPSAHSPSSSDVLWDSWGVPHIYASDRRAALYAFGWAQMQAHGAAIARSYAAARGQAAAYAGESAFMEDVLVHQLRIPERAHEALAHQEPRYREYLTAFVRGLNDYQTQHPASIPPAYRALLPFTEADVLAHIQRVLLTRFLFGDHVAVLDYAAELESAHAEPAPRAASHGSNGYAIGPARSASGHAMLVINPHLLWTGELAQFEAQITEGDHFIYGAALVGQPYIAMGFSEALGWTHTVNDFDALDTYELELRDGGYLFDGAVRAFEASDPVTVQVRTAHGERRLVARSVERLSSVHGPVILHAPAAGRALAVRFSAGAADQLVRRYWQQADARDVRAFEAAADRDRLACFNTLYADSHGDILYRYEGVMPRRAGGDYASWQGIQRGESSGNLWTTFYEAKALPRVLNPASGFLQNANDPPWLVTLPALDAKAFPPYIAPPGLDYRAQQSLRRLTDGRKLSFEDLVALKQSNHVELAERFVPALLAAAADQNDLAEARQLLSSWDRNLSADAKGAVLFLAWAKAMDEAFGDDWTQDRWSPREPTATPRGLKDPAQAVHVLRQTSALVRKRYGKLAIPYGAVYRLRLGKYDLPAATGSAQLGVYSTAEFAAAANGKQVAWGGDSFVAVVEFGMPMRARGLLTYGNSSQRGSAHLGDQLALFSARELRPLWLTRAEVDAHITLREHLAVPQLQ